MKDRIRITGGTMRGRRLHSPPSNSIRPCSDMVRQAVFNMLGQELHGTVFYDVFAGTGVVGIEALSRGAERSVFIEKELRQIQLIRRNLEDLQVPPPKASVRQTDAFLWAQRFVPENLPGIVYLGPPYPDFEEDERMMVLPAAVQQRLRDQDLLVFQFPSTVDPTGLPDFDNWYRIRSYGKTSIAIWQRDSARGRDADEDRDETDNDSEPLDSFFEEGGSDNSDSGSDDADQD